MKTSNKIIVAFATFILGGMLLLFVDAKQNKIKMANDLTFKEYSLPAFSVVVAENGSELHVDQSESRIIKVQYNKNKHTPIKLYEVTNDTLHIYSGLCLFVKCPKISAIIGNKPLWVGVNNFSPDSITIKMNGGKLFWNDYDYKPKKIEGIVNIGLITNDSAYVQIRNIKLLNISVKSNNSEVNILSSPKYSTFKLENHSKIFCYDSFDKLTVKKDTTSKLSIGN